jgi:flavodoxin
MSKILVTFYSRTGNTKQVAEAIYDALEGEKSIEPIGQHADRETDEFSLVFVGFPVHSHSVPYAVGEFLKSIPEGKKIAFFSTHGSLSGSRLSREALENATVLAAKAHVLGTFSCRGRVSHQALEVLMKSPEHRAWTGMAASAATHPDASDLEDARNFAAWVLTLAHAKRHPSG